MFKLINYNWRSKYNYIVLILTILVLLNLRIIIRNEIIDSRIFSVLVTNLSWYFFSLLLLIILRIQEFYKMLFIKKDGFSIKSELSSYKIIASKIFGGLVEFFIMTALVISVIAINLQLINTGFFEQSINILKLSGVNPNREIPIFFITLFLSYILLLETLYLPMVIVKTLFTDFKYKKTLSFAFFQMISLINIAVINSMLKDIVDYNFITVNVIIVKTVLLIILCYMLTSFLLGEN